jgi:hypothetical protein
LRTVSRSLLRRKRFTLRFSGRTVRDGIGYRWSTTLRVVRLRRAHTSTGETGPCPPWTTAGIRRPGHTLSPNSSRTAST